MVEHCRGRPARRGPRFPSRRCARIARPPRADRLTLNQALTVPADALVILIGAAGSGKTTFAARHFRPTEVLSSDALRATVADDPADQTATDDAFQLLSLICELRLRRGRLTVIDAKNVEAWARARLLDLAWRLKRPSVAVVLDLDLPILLERNDARTDGPRPPAAVRRQQRWLREGLANLADEGFAAVTVLRTPAEIAAMRVERGAPHRDAAS